MKPSPSSLGNLQSIAESLRTKLNSALSEEATAARALERCEKRRVDVQSALSNAVRELSDAHQSLQRSLR